MLALSHHLAIKFPYTVLPGSLGGVLSNMAVADGSVYVATIDFPITSTSPSSVDSDKFTRRQPSVRAEQWTLRRGTVRCRHE